MTYEADTGLGFVGRPGRHFGGVWSPILGILWVTGNLLIKLAVNWAGTHSRCGKALLEKMTKV